MRNVKNIQRTWEMYTDTDSRITLEAFASDDDYSYNISGESGYLSGLTVNDTDDLIAMIQAANDWMNERGKEDADE